MKVIHSVIGFNLHRDVYNQEGQIIRPGIARTCISCTDEKPNFGNNMGNTKWFTNFNEDLLQKIRDYRRIND